MSAIQTASMRRAPIYSFPFGADHAISISPSSLYPKLRKRDRARRPHSPSMIWRPSRAFTEGSSRATPISRKIIAKFRVKAPEDGAFIFDTKRLQVWHIEGNESHVIDQAARMRWPLTCMEAVASAVL